MHDVASAQTTQHSLGQALDHPPLVGYKFQGSGVHMPSRVERQQESLRRPGMTVELCTKQDCDHRGVACCSQCMAGLLTADQVSCDPHTQPHGWLLGAVVHERCSGHRCIAHRGMRTQT